MIYRAMYVDKIMSYVDTPFVKIHTGGKKMWKVNHFKNDNARLPERRVSYHFDSMEYEDMTAKQMFIELKKAVF